MRPLFAVLVAVVVLVAAAPAAAGGFATAGLAPPPDDISARETWVARVTILRHGRAPLTDVAPSVTIVNEATGERSASPALTTDEPGVYEARVDMPAAGSWRYEVDDGLGFGETHTFAPFEVGPAADSGVPLARIGLGAVSVVLAAGAAWALGRLRRGRAMPALR